MRPRARHEDGNQAPASGLARRSSPTGADDESVPPTKPSIAPPPGVPEFTPGPSRAYGPVDTQLPTLTRRVAPPLGALGVGTATMVSAAATASHDAWASGLALSAFGLGMFAIGCLALARATRRQTLELERQVRRVARVIGGGSVAQEVAGGTTCEVDRVSRAILDLAERVEGQRAELEEHAQRTRADEAGLARVLEQENQDLRRVLAQQNRAVLSVDPQGRISRECSPTLAGWFGPVPHSGVLWDYLDQACEGQGLRFESAWGSALGPRDAAQIALEGMPRHLTASGRSFDVTYEPIVDDAGRLERVLVVLSDVTVVANDRIIQG